MSDPHESLKRVAEGDGWSAQRHGDWSDDQFIATQKAKMLLHPVDSRVKALQDLDAVISASNTDGSSRRKQAGLVRVRREMARAHEMMLKVGR
jgi:hypothetical protein